jgi:nucleotide-binding universal stress UspA family protein
VNAPEKPILIGYDGSDTAKRAIREGAELLGHRQALVVTVWDPTIGYDVGTMTDDTSLALVDAEEAQEFDDELKETAHRTAKEGEELAKSSGFEADSLVVADEGSVSEAIADLARKRGSGAIVVGSKGRRGLLARLEGSTAKGVLKHTPCPVLVVHEDAATDASDKPIVIAFDGSDPARRAVSVAGELLAGRSAVVATAWESRRADAAAEAHAHDVARSGAELATSAGLQAEALAASDQTNVAATLVAIARDRDAAAIVIGSRGLTGLRARFEGSASSDTLKQAPCPVLVVHDD